MIFKPCCWVISPPGVVGSDTPARQYRRNKTHNSTKLISIEFIVETQYQIRAYSEGISMEIIGLARQPSRVIWMSKNWTYIKKLQFFYLLLTLFHFCICLVLASAILLLGRQLFLLPLASKENDSLTQNLSCSVHCNFSTNSYVCNVLKCILKTLFCAHWRTILHVKF